MKISLELQRKPRESKRLLQDFTAGRHPSWGPSPPTAAWLPHLLWQQQGALGRVCDPGLTLRRQNGEKRRKQAYYPGPLRGKVLYEGIPWGSRILTCTLKEVTHQIKLPVNCSSDLRGVESCRRETFNGVRRRHQNCHSPESQALTATPPFPG